MAAEPLRLTVSVRVEAAAWQGGPPPMANGSLDMTERFQLPIGSFPELAEVLGRFHDLAQEIGAEIPQ